ncbi:amiloride-sensitive sodium channel subunit beta [Elysia marginata]|uniref:Amiloride-sensitive sodium channel subunit beta n=1 Tax=Elysia marginata TaxID=1093978 RepID=A0AAV4FM17_9GAST|nr:amiloride-sensitive sodium channel subunit beta [Elysia marginata]
MIPRYSSSDYGLKLTLNVEQYEYMPGPHDAAGVKILLHDQREFPKVAELGLAIPTGTHTYVGIQLLRVSNKNQTNCQLAMFCVLNFCTFVVPLSSTAGG